MRRRRFTLRSPAKLNLFLEVLGRRPDGYHAIETVFQEISLADSLAVEEGPPGLACDDPSLPVDGRNLVLRAARAFWARFPDAPRASFRLKKRIPVGAGLGGGSGNAAAALRALRDLMGNDPGEAVLRRLARGLGADVPFFLRGGLARGTGIGDRLRPIVRRGEAPWFVLVFPRIFSSTPAAYAGLRFPLTRRRSCLRLTRALAAGESPRVWAPELFNRLEQSVLPRLAPAARAKAALLQAGCLNAALSGSGSCVFGAVEGRAHGRRVAAEIRREPWDVWVVRSVDRP